MVFFFSKKIGPDVFVVYLVLTEHLFIRESAFSNGVHASFSIGQRGLITFEIRHPPAVSGIKTKEIDNGTIGTFFML